MTNEDQLTANNVSKFYYSMFNFKYHYNFRIEDKGTIIVV